MKQILVFFVYNSNLKRREQKKNFFKRLFAANDVKFTFSFYDDLEYIISPDKFELLVAGVPIQTFDVVYFRGRKLAREMTRVSKPCEIMGLKVLNDNGGKYIFIDKLFQKMVAFQQRVPFPKTYFSNIKESLVEKYRKAKDIVGLTMIVKGSDSTLGRNNMFIHSENELVDIEIEDALFQEHIVNTFDYRLNIFGNKTKVVAKRTRKDNTTHLNYSLNNKLEFFTPEEIDQEIVQNAEKMTKALSLEIAGVDYVVGVDGQGYYLETNSAPQYKLNSIEEDAFVEYLSK